MPNVAENSMPELAVLVDAARNIVFTAKRENTLGALTLKTVRKQVERDLSLKDGTLDREDLRGALKQATTTALQEDPPPYHEGEDKVKPPSNIQLDTKPTATPERASSKNRTAQKEETLKNTTKSNLHKSSITVDTDTEDENIKNKVIHTKKQSTPSKGKRKISVRAEKSESEQSMADSGPSKKKRRTSKPLQIVSKVPSQSSKRGHSTPISASDTPQDETPEDTVARLKKLVATCGSRKQWAKVFADMPEPQKQIEELHQILNKMGMKRPYTIEQAKQVKRQREIQRELAAVIEFEKKAGVSGSRRKGKRAELDTESENNDESEEEKSEEEKAPASKKIMQYLAQQGVEGD
ncbi:hypothetical protein M422DRAFT_24017 [Sphaerobolus stellatus SS14]|nr:hypothetical protein M422DRAFT_24017 [Sphaerobolus stellatus SS14]